MKVYSILLICLGLFDLSSAQIKINAWNIEVFGKSKMDEPEVVDVLVQVIVQYDLILIQEIRDIDEVAIYELLALCNGAASDPYDIALSPRLGRTSNKEQYAFFYRKSLLEVSATYLWPDTNDVFEREPWVVLFRSVDSSFADFGFIPCHVDPDDAVAENDYLVDVYDDMIELWGISDFIIGGDLNFDCSYVTDDEKEESKLRTDSRFIWLIDDEADTTVAEGTECAYDRLIVTGDVAAINPGVYYFDEDLGLDQELAEDVSDHYPVIMDLQTTHRQEARKVT